MKTILITLCVILLVSQAIAVQLTHNRLKRHHSAKRVYHSRRHRQTGPNEVLVHESLQKNPVSTLKKILNKISLSMFNIGSNPNVAFSNEVAFAEDGLTFPNLQQGKTQWKDAGADVESLVVDSLIPYASIVDCKVISSEGWTRWDYNTVHFTVKNDEYFTRVKFQILKSKKNVFGGSQLVSDSIELSNRCHAAQQAILAAEAAVVEAAVAAAKDEAAKAALRQQAADQAAAEEALAKQIREDEITAIKKAQADLAALPVQPAASEEDAEIVVPDSPLAAFELLEAPTTAEAVESLKNELSENLACAQQIRDVRNNARSTPLSKALYFKTRARNAANLEGENNADKKVRLQPRLERNWRCYLIAYQLKNDEE